ncbi:Inosose dehydratase [Rubellimicrobium mesophilum DSM 19309]|uniref:Inosose dehydratase n=1 Tax=Rubellimicrobium mesophilum DSM 19309 TaxID=442562 RepID=A0A017HT15_9RHOB|nr:myo-inosose-2 dehydratase [Rubellimicrobium mesophilum]EYD76899.1 Inosose dehydratase [Rubellimicrobium mesophilum DSM 19309]
MTQANLPAGVRLGVSPLSWTNEVLEELGGDIPLETCLSEAAGNGYAGVELGRKFPRDLAVLGPLLKAHGLALASGWHSGFLAERDIAAEMEAVRDHATLLAALGAEVMVYGPVGRMAPETPLDIPMTNRVRLTADEATTYADRLREFEVRLFGEHGLKLAYHHHLMMVAETFDEVSRVIERARCGLLVDTGHAFAAGWDYARLFERFGDLVTHIHLKDVRAERLAEVRERDLSFNDAVRMGMFTVPGDGAVDFAPVADFVRRSGYQGWLIVEAEQDPSRPEASPRAATKRAFDHVTALFRE